MLRSLNNTRSFHYVIALACLIMFTTSSAHAQLFGIGGIVFDARNFSQNVLLYKRVLDQLATQRQQLQAQVTAMRKLATPPWRDISRAMSQIDALTRQGEAISYSLGNVDALFRSTFPGTRVTGKSSITEQMQANRTLATLRGTLNAAKRSAAEFPMGLTRLRTMKQQMASVQGHEQALELNGVIDMYSAEQLTMLSQQLAALTNAQSVYFAHDINQQAQTDANARALFAQLGKVPTSRPSFSFRVR